MVGDQCRVFVCSMSDDTVEFTQNEEIRSQFTIV